MIKDIYEKPTATVRLDGERLKAFLLRSRIRQECVLSPLPLNNELIVPRQLGETSNKKYLDRKKQN